MESRYCHVLENGKVITQIFTQPYRDNLEELVFLAERKLREHTAGNTKIAEIHTAFGILVVTTHEDFMSSKRQESGSLY